MIALKQSMLAIPRMERMSSGFSEFPKSLVSMWFLTLFPSLLLPGFNFMCFSSFPGNQYLHQFCVCAVSSIVSPFVLHDVALEAAQFLARLNPSMAMQHLRSALTPLVQKCQQM